MTISESVATTLASAAIPTLAVLIGILINNQRLNDFARTVDQRFNDLNRNIDQRFTESHRHVDDTRDLLRADMFRIEQVLDARLKHLEEHR
jgi:hypothetical protein